MVVPADLLNNLGTTGLRLEVTLGTIPQPIRAVPSARVQLDQMIHFDTSATFSLSPLGGGQSVDDLKLEVDVDLNQAAPGLLVFNLWSSSSHASCLLNTGSTLLLSPDLDHILGDLTDGACGEDLLADLADFIDASSASPILTDVVYLRSLLDAARDIFEWSREAGCVSLERLLFERTLILQQRLAANKEIIHDEENAAGHKSVSSDVKLVGEDLGQGSLLLAASEFDSCKPAACQPALKMSAQADRRKLYLICCWSLMLLHGNWISLRKSMTKGKGLLVDTAPSGEIHARLHLWGSYFLVL